MLSGAQQPKFHTMSSSIFKVEVIVKVITLLLGGKGLGVTAVKI